MFLDCGDGNVALMDCVAQKGARATGADSSAPASERSSFATDETQPTNIMEIPVPPEAPEAALDEETAEVKRRAFQGNAGIPSTPTEVMTGRATTAFTPSSEVRDSSVVSYFFCA